MKRAMIVGILALVVGCADCAPTTKVQTEKKLPTCEVASWSVDPETKRANFIMVTTPSGNRSVLWIEVGGEVELPKYLEESRDVVYRINWPGWMLVNLFHGKRVVLGGTQLARVRGQSATLAKYDGGQK